MRKRKAMAQVMRVLLVAGVTLILIGMVQAGDIDSTDKWAWSTNVGWINFHPIHVDAVVYNDHLEGYVWGENVGWIRLGTYEAGGSHSYANDAASTYGVNNDGSGNLSGYAWGTDVGWINFDPTNGGVTAYSDHLEGYAWGENIGWIRMGTHTGGGAHTYGNTGPSDYGVNVAPDGTLSGYAWSTNTGWINFNPYDVGVAVYSDHLEGYAWGENIGWIRLGSYDGGGAHTYANDAADTYGVNRDGCGNLSGYAWGTNVGWINFNPSHSQVTIDPATGSFDGYAWGENVGWIHFKNTDPAYNVVTSFRVASCPGDLTCDYQVGTDDIMLAANGWRKHPGEGGYDARVDRDGDDTITVDEIQWFAAQWGSCG